MAKILTAKELLSTYNILDPESKKKHAHYEFQAFAYKLAHDLNDLANLRIYMRLAKNVERSIMERAYSYALDADSDNRGKLFMWKLKELRKEVDDARNRQNFSYEYVSVQMKIFREKIASTLVKKVNRFDDLLIFNHLDTESKKINKVLLLNCININLVEKILTKNFRIYSNEYSRGTRKFILEYFGFLENKIQPKVVTTDFLQNKYKDNTFDLVMINESWLSIPLELEKQYLAEIKRVLKDEGRIQLVSRVVGEKQEWKKFNYTPAGKDSSWQSEDLNYLEKSNSQKGLEKLFKDLDLKILETKESATERVFVLGSSLLA